MDSDYRDLGTKSKSDLNLLARDLTGEKQPATWIEAAFGMTLGDFDQNVRGSRFLKGRLPDEKWRDLFTWEHLNLLLNTSDRRTSMVHVIQQGEYLNKSKYTREVSGNRIGAIAPDALARAMREGHSLMLQQAQGYHAPFQDLADQLTLELSEFVGINVYVSWCTDRCFNTHWDSHDVLILQTEGEKEWSVFEPTRQFPMGDDVEYSDDDENLTLAWNGTLKAGDVLYVPRGWWHHAKSTDEGSIHLTCGFENRTGVDAFRHLLTLATQSEEFRRDLPRPVIPADGEFNTEFRDQLRSFIDTAIDSKFMRDFWLTHFSDMPPRRRHHLPATIDFELFRTGNYELQISSSAALISLERAEDEFTLDIGIRRWVFASAAYDLIRSFTEGRKVEYRSILDAPPGDLTAEDCEQLVFELLNEGVLNITKQL
ncbi:JmjC domain-containing protein [Maricaulis sp. D1M11]|uniref:JmjC domain-containing protein n=1 Tax=Maricaulis sp. D1M11 TaxID=3076117 RepID=UPI0039B3B3E8